MWEKEESWLVSWSGKTIWGNYYSDSQYFNNESDTDAFVETLKNQEGIYYINKEKNTIWRLK